MRLIRVIPISEIKVALDLVSLEFVGFILVVSEGMLKVYKQIR